ARPAFKLPCRKKLSTTLLDQVYNKTKKDVEMLINNDNNQNLCLISDGWSNLVREHWTNYILATPKPVFYAAYPTNEARQNKVTIANNLEKIIIEIGTSKISAIITDNASVMKKAWHLLELDYPEILFL
ncbi:24685_t:CDS:1, partial [Gigaspora rosea]